MYYVKVTLKWLPSSFSGLSPGKTHLPASIQNGLEIKNGPHKNPLLTHLIVASHLELASQIQPIQLFVTLPSSSKQTSVPK